MNIFAIIINRNCEKDYYHGYYSTKEKAEVELTLLLEELGYKTTSEASLHGSTIYIKTIGVE